MYKFLIIEDDLKYEGLYPSALEALTDILKRKPRAQKISVTGAQFYETNYPDPHPVTGHRVVSVADACGLRASWYDSGAIVSWRAVEIEPKGADGEFYVSFWDGSRRIVPGAHAVYIPAQEYEVLKCGN